MSDEEILHQKITEVINDYVPDYGQKDFESQWVLFKALLMCPQDVTQRLLDAYGIEDMVSNESMIHAVVEHEDFNYAGR